MTPRLSLFASLALAGCAYISDKDEAYRLDPDGDGVPIGEDCDDTDRTLGASVTWWVDADGDSYGDPDTEASGCEPPANGVSNADDCDDSDSSTYPGAVDAWYDGKDANCLGDDDYDADADGYRPPEYGGNDCDDTDPSQKPDPAITEIYYNGLDDNCDTDDGDGDADADGYWAADYNARVVANGAAPLEVPAGAEGDCWDDPTTTPAAMEVINGFSSLLASEVNPGAAERYYDGADQDCAGEDADDDGQVDDFDWDGDGFASEVYADGEGTTGTDCLDCDCEGDACPDGCDSEISNPGGVAPAAVNPEATETYYDGTDANCDAASDYDQDADGYAADGHGGTDCGDLDPDTWLGAPDDWYDGIDSDCGGEDDHDADDDGYVRDEDSGKQTFEGEGGAALTGSGALPSGDCNDDPDASGSFYSPAVADDWYDGEDSDCAGDDDHDADGDGYVPDAYAGDRTHQGDTSQPLSGTGSLPAGDCDDDNAAVNPGEIEVCGNGIDDDCSADPGECELAGAIAASAADVVVEGRQQYGYYGFALSTGDFDGDGDADLLSSAYCAGSTSGYCDGAVYLHLGPLSSSESVTDADLSISGASAASDSAGYRVDSLGDLDGDGFDDFAASAPRYDTGSSNVGLVGVFYGPATGASTLYADADLRFVGGSASTYLGYGTAGHAVGDQDSDGSTDLLFGGPYATGGGDAWLVLGPASASSDLDDHVRLRAESSSDAAGWALGGGEDLTGDGFPDLVVSSRYYDTGGSSNVGKVYVLEGPVTGDMNLSGAHASAQGADASEAAGTSVDATGDLDGDGNLDLVIGAPGGYSGSTAVGRAYVVYGPHTGDRFLATAADVTVFGPASNSAFGVAVVGGADFDDDGKDDLAVGADQAASNAGRVFVFYGSLGGTYRADLDADAIITGPASSAYSGSALDGRSDFDGDGFPDLVVGAQYASPGSTAYTGGIYLFAGGAI